MVLALDHVYKNYGHRQAVSDVSYTFTHGVYGLLGVNGAGKSSLMRLMCAIAKPTSGSITYGGCDLIALGGTYRQVLGYLPQHFGFYPDLKVHAYLSYMANLKGLRPIVAKDRIEALLNAVGLQDRAGTRMKNLSGGMQRRVGIAQALLNDPKVLVLDEPTAGLDPKERLRFRSLISRFANDRIVVISTHIVADVDYLAHELLLMKDGRLVVTGNAASLVERMGGMVWEVQVPTGQIDRYRQAFLVSNIRIDGQVASLRIIDERKPDPTAQPVAGTMEDVCLSIVGGDRDG